MAVSAIILDPQNEFEQLFTIPVAGQRSFETYWLPAIESIHTKWIINIQYGTDLTKTEADCFIHELDVLLSWVDEHIKDDVREQMLSRIHLLQTNLPKAFQREDAIIFID